MAEEAFDWDTEDFDPDAGFQPKKSDDRWEGEDEGLDSEALKAEEAKEVVKPKKDRKNKEERVAEKKAKRRAEELAQKAGQPLEGGEKEEATDEEQFAEKLRLQQVQKDSDLQVAKELFGATPVAASSLDNMLPVSSEDFNTFEEALVTKISQFETTPHYTGLLARLVPRITAGLDVEDLRKLSQQLSLMATEKHKAKAPKIKKKGKVGLHGLGKGTKKADVFDIDMAAGDYEDMGGEYDDFM